MNDTPMAVARQHQFQVLTKRPLRLAKLLSRSDFRGINWVIVGGESGHGFRPFNLDWVRAR